MSQDAKIIFGIGTITVLILLGSVFFLSKNTTQKVSSKGDIEKVLNENNNHKIASDSAKVTVIEFADFQCPACGQAYPQIKRILHDYEGKINYIYRHFPLPQHQNALPAARAAEAAGEQGKFWEMADILFTKQLDWSEKGNATEVFLNYAKDLKLNIDQFKQSLNSNKFESTINKDKEDGLSLGINSTPTIFINNKHFVQPITYENIRAGIEAELVRK